MLCTRGILVIHEINNNNNNKNNNNSQIRILLWEIMVH